MAASAGSRVVSSDANLLAPSKTRTRTQNAANAGSSSVMDPSVLRPSINVSITGMRQAVQLLETGTKEVRNYLLHECNLLYECKTCQNLFRSVGNLIAHKRHYCRHRYQDVRHVYRRDPGEMGLVVGADQSEDATGATRACAASTPQTTAFVQPEAVETIVKEKDWNLSDYHPSLELLHQAGTIEEIERRPLVSRLHNQAAAPTTTTTAQRAGLASVVQRLREKADNGPEQEYYERRQREALIRLEKIQQTDRAVFQTVGPPDTTTMGQRYVELQHLRQSPCVFVGPDGRIVEPGPLPPVQPNPGSIGVNGVGGGSVGGAQSNEGYDSSKENLLYPCPLCKKEYSMLQNVLRHITRLHKKPLDEAKLLRKKSKKMAIAAHNKKKRTQQHQDLVKERTLAVSGGHLVAPADASTSSRAAAAAAGVAAEAAAADSPGPSVRAESNNAPNQTGKAKSAAPPPAGAAGRPPSTTPAAAGGVGVAASKRPLEVNKVRPDPVPAKRVRFDLPDMEGGSPTNKSVTAGPIKKKPATTGPANKKLGATSPTDRKLAAAVPANKKPAAAGPTNRKPATTGPTKKKPATTGPTKESPAPMTSTTGRESAKSAGSVSTNQKPASPKTAGIAGRRKKSPESTTTVAKKRGRPRNRPSPEQKGQDPKSLASAASVVNGNKSMEMPKDPTPLPTAKKRGRGRPPKEGTQMQA